MIPLLLFRIGPGGTSLSQVIVATVTGPTLVQEVDSTVVANDMSVDATINTVTFEEDV